LEVELEAAVVAHSVPDEPRGQAVVAGRPALTQCLDRGVGGGGALGRRLEGVLAPSRVHLFDAPRPAGEEGRRRRHAVTEGTRPTTVPRAMARARNRWGWGFE